VILVIAFTGLSMFGQNPRRDRRQRRAPTESVRDTTPEQLSDSLKARLDSTRMLQDSLRVADSTSRADSLDLLGKSSISKPAFSAAKDSSRQVFVDGQRKMFYCGDVQCFGYYPTYAKKLWNEHNVKLDITEDDLQSLKEGCVDMYTFSYYMSMSVTTHKGEEGPSGNMVRGTKNEYLEYSDWGWAYDPDGLQYYLEMIYDRYERPLMVVENGIGAYDTVEADGSIHDPYRIDYFRKHIASMKKAILWILLILKLKIKIQLLLLYKQLKKIF